MLKALKEIWPMIVGFLIVVSGMLTIQYSSNQKLKDHLEHLNVSFSGVVIKDTRVDHFNLCLIDLAVANPTSYDVRAEEDFYFCVIKGDKAEFVGDSFKYQLEIGDSISVIPKPIRLINYTKNTIHKIKLPSFMTILVYREMRKKHEL